MRALLELEIAQTFACVAGIFLLAAAPLLVSIALSIWAR
jgi:hypothetical protein